MLCSTNVKISLNQSKVCRIGINWTFMHINVLTAHDFGKVVLLLRDRWSMCPCITQPSFLHSWLWMEVDKLQEITHIATFSWSPFYCLLPPFSPTFFLRIHYLFLKGFQNSHFSHESIAPLFLGWLKRHEPTGYFSKKGEIVFRVSNFPGGMLRSLPYSSKVEVVIPLCSLWTYDRRTAVVSPLVRLRFTRNYQEIKERLKCYGSGVSFSSAAGFRVPSSCNVY